MKTVDWYQTLIRPVWAPPAWLFGPVWSVLYILIAVSFGYVVYLFLAKKISFIVLLPFILNLVFNLAFSPIEFGLNNLVLGSLDIVLTLATLIWALLVIYPYTKWVSFMNVPYLLWVCFATALQLNITVMNI